MPTYIALWLDRLKNLAQNRLLEFYTIRAGWMGMGKYGSYPLDFENYYRVPQEKSTINNDNNNNNNNDNNDIKNSIRVFLCACFLRIYRMLYGLHCGRQVHCGRQGQQGGQGQGGG